MSANRLFNVTYDTVTERSARTGDFADNGFVAKAIPLRQAIELFLEPGGRVEANEFPVHEPRWLTCYPPEDRKIEDGIESRSLHFPEDLSAGSRLRIARLVGCYGLERNRQMENEQTLSL